MFACEARQTRLVYVRSLLLQETDACTVLGRGSKWQDLWIANCSATSVNSGLLSWMHVLLKPALLELKGPAGEYKCDSHMYVHIAHKQALLDEVLTCL